MSQGAFSEGLQLHDPSALSRKAHRRKPPALAVMLALGWLVLCVASAVAVDWIKLHDLAAIDLRARLTPPVFFGGSWNHPFGTDELGRDLYSRLLFSLRLSLLLATLGTMIGMVLGTALGLAAAHFRGFVDNAVMVAIDIQAALPFFIIALVAVAILGPSLWLFVMLLGTYGWERYARLARAMAMSASERGYIEALRGFGMGPMRIHLRHILPNIAGVLLVNATLTFSEVLLLESTLSFLGLGIQPPMTSLGNMVGYGRDYLLSASWIAVVPSLVILSTTLAVTIIGDRVRDRLDPHTS